LQTDNVLLIYKSKISRSGHWSVVCCCLPFTYFYGTVWRMLRWTVGVATCVSVLWLVKGSWTCRIWPEVWCSSPATSTPSHAVDLPAGQQGDYCN